MSHSALFFHLKPYTLDLNVQVKEIKNNPVAFQMVCLSPFCRDLHEVYGQKQNDDFFVTVY